VSTSYYNGFRVMCVAPALLGAIVMIIYAVARSWHRAMLSRTDAEAGHECRVGAPSRLYKTPLLLTRAGKASLGLWGAWDACLDAVEDALCARCRRGRAPPPTAGYATLRGAEAALEAASTAAGCGDEYPRLYTLRVYGTLSGGSRGARLWKGLTLLRDDHNMLGGRELCACVPRDPRAEKPEPFALCERGRAQYFVLQLRMRVRARRRSRSRSRIARPQPCWPWSRALGVVVVVVVVVLCVGVGAGVCRKQHVACMMLCNADRASAAE
jgi:hypothetical protein